MVKSCYVPGCRTGYDKTQKGSKLSLFTPPPHLVEAWDAEIRRTDRPLTKTSGVCELHFEEHLIERVFRYIINGEEVLFERGRKTLKKDAVPTIFPRIPKSGKVGNSRKLGVPRKGSKRKRLKNSRVTTNTCQQEKHRFGLRSGGPVSVVQQVEPSPSFKSGTQNFVALTEDHSHSPLLESNRQNMIVVQGEQRASLKGVSPSSAVGVPGEKTKNSSLSAISVTGEKNRDSSLPAIPKTAEKTRSTNLSWEGMKLISLPNGWGRYMNKEGDTICLFYTKHDVAFATVIHVEWKLNEATPKVVIRDRDISSKIFETWRTVDPSIISFLSHLERIMLCKGMQVSEFPDGYEQKRVVTMGDRFYSKKCVGVYIGNFVCSAVCKECRYVKKLLVRKKERKAKLPKKLVDTVSLRTIHRYVVREIKLKNRIKDCLHANIVKKANVLEEAINSLPEKQQEAVRHCFQGSKPKGTRYTKEWLVECMLMHSTSPCLYRYIQEKKILVMPSVRTLQKYLDTGDDVLNNVPNSPENHVALSDDHECSSPESQVVLPEDEESSSPEDIDYGNQFNCENVEGNVQKE